MAKKKEKSVEAEKNSDLAFDFKVNGDSSVMLTQIQYQWGEVFLDNKLPQEIVEALQAGGEVTFKISQK